MQTAEQTPSTTIEQAVDFCNILTKYINSFIDHPALDDREELESALAEIEGYRQVLATGQMPANFESDMRSLGKHIYKLEPEEANEDRQWLKDNGLNYCQGIAMVALNYERENGKPAPGTVLAAYSQLEAMRALIEADEFPVHRVVELRGLGRQMMKDVRESLA